MLIMFDSTHLKALIDGTTVPALFISG